MGCGSPGWWSVELGRCSTCRGVAVAPEQAVFALAVCVGGDARDVTLSISNEEGAASGRDKGGIFCSGACFRNRATANASICAVILKGKTNQGPVLYKKIPGKEGCRDPEILTDLTDLLQALADLKTYVTVLD